MFMESWILRVSCKVNVKPFGLHLLCNRPEVFMIPWTFQNRIHFLSNFGVKWNTNLWLSWYSNTPKMRTPIGRNQDVQSRGQHDWIHGFPEPVKSFVTFVILSQISCGKVQKPPHIFSAQDCVNVSSLFAVVSQITLTNWRQNGKFSAIGFTLQLVEVI